MAARTNWEGYLKLNLLSVPVKAYTATMAQGGKIRFHMLHAECKSRIQYKKECPIHGEVPNDEIVSGYEFAKGKYVVVDKAELEKLLPEKDKTINIDVFIHPEDLDPIYIGDRSYYLVPDGRVAQKPYAVVQQVMAEQNRYAIAKIVLSTREHVVMLRAVEGLLVMTILNYDEEVKKPSMFADEAPEVKVAKSEHDLAESLVEASTAKEFDMSRYTDEYSGMVTKLLEATAGGKEVVQPRGHEEPAVINLMDALRKSLAHTKSGGKATNGRAPAKAKRSESKAQARRGAGRRKTV
jgi:DNA end-binding protein Ku